MAGKFTILKAAQHFGRACGKTEAQIAGYVLKGRETKMLPHSGHGGRGSVDSPTAGIGTCSTLLVAMMLPKQPLEALLSYQDGHFSARIGFGNLIIETFAGQTVTAVTMPLFVLRAIGEAATPLSGEQFCDQLLETILAVAASGGLLSSAQRTA